MSESLTLLNRREAMGLGVAASALLASRGMGAEMAKDAKTLRFQREIPILKARDVVVCGGGPSGIAAALAARRAGLDVLLVEGQGQLGGTSTSGLVSHWLGGRTSDCKRWVVSGLFRELSEEAAERGAALVPGPPKSKYQPHGWYRGQLAAGIPLDPFGVAQLLDEKMAKDGVEVLLLTQAVGVRVEGNRISHVIVHNKSGLAAVPAKAVVDATGDADVAARSGCEVEKGGPEGGMAAATLEFHVSGVEQDALSAAIHKGNCPRFRKKIQDLRKQGEWPFPYDIFISVQLTEPGTMMINTSRLVGIDGTDAASVTDGMIRGRAETHRLLAVMRKHFPGFANARLKAVAPLLGVRETRRIRGPYVLSVADLNAGRDFPDTIGFSAYGWDLPNPKRPSDNPSHGRKRAVTPIPYRILVPKPVTNLICPGRAVSVERPVLGPLRVMAPCMAMGQAAGQAARQVVQDGATFAEVNTEKLRGELRQAGAIIEWKT